MSLVDRLYDWLATAPTPDADLILLTALDQADAPHDARILRLLLQRENETAYGGLASRFEMLPSDVQSAMLDRIDPTCDGVARAMEAGPSEARLNALMICANLLTPRLAYVLPTGLRDGSRVVREMAASILLDTAEQVLRSGADPAARAQVAQALREGLWSFDRHGRAEVVRGCLWMARELGEELWQRLEAPHARAAGALAGNLHAWNEPWLAYFLLSALARPAWRVAALRKLAAWSGTTELAELLRQSDLLENPEIRGRLAALKSPRWLERVRENPSEAPESLRPALARWISFLGIAESDKITLLSRWLGSNDAALLRAAAYGLAALDSPAATDALRPLLRESGAPGALARWYERGQQERARARSAGLTPGQTHAWTNTDVLVRLWQKCRRTPPQRRGPLVARIRSQAEEWHGALAMYLKAPDPRDRALALHVVCGSELAPRFREEIAAMRSDPIGAIREFARLLTTDRAGAHGASAHGSPAPGEAERRRRELERAFAELQESLEPGLEGAVP